jgi:hypothetical protein
MSVCVMGYIKLLKELRCYGFTVHTDLSVVRIVEDAKKSLYGISLFFLFLFLEQHAQYIKHKRVR